MGWLLGLWFVIIILIPNKGTTTDGVRPLTKGHNQLIQ